mmetsp:Transcript_98657/g.307360  ORF Transcript_98657/g.307360 Transcript_98657/m.307360 type:complete len:241 (+) Transcript_98657:317-1039(+)
MCRKVGRSSAQTSLSASGGTPAWKMRPGSSTCTSRNQREAATQATMHSVRTRLPTLRPCAAHACKRAAPAHGAEGGVPSHPTVLRARVVKHGPRCGSWRLSRKAFKSCIAPWRSEEGSTTAASLFRAGERTSWSKRSSSSAFSVKAPSALAATTLARSTHSVPTVSSIASRKRRTASGRKPAKWGASARTAYAQAVLETFREVNWLIRVIAAAAIADISGPSLLFRRANDQEMLASSCGS